MPRNASGQYTLPAGNPVVADTLIESDGWANPTMEDLGAEVEDSLSRDGKGAMRAALGIVDGSEANPGLRFIAETGSGAYRDSDGVWWLTVKGVGKIQVTEFAGITIDDDLIVTGDTTIQGTLILPGGITAPVIITGTTDVPQLEVLGAPGQTADIQQWKDDGGVIHARIDKDGNFYVLGTGTEAQRLEVSNQPAQARIFKRSDENTGGPVDIRYDIVNSVGSNYDANHDVGASTDADDGRWQVHQMNGLFRPAFGVAVSKVSDFVTAFTQRFSGTQAANLHEWKDEAGVVLSAIDKDGNFVAGAGGGGQAPDNTGNVPVGAIMHWPLTPPSLGVEWLICDGANYLDTAYPALAAYLGVAYGMTGGGGTFNVPDYRGNFLRGQDMGAGVDPQAGIRTDRGDGTTGDFPGTRQAEDVLATAIGAHTHLYLGVLAGPLAGGGGFAGVMTPTGPAIGGGTGIETRPVNVYTVIAIKAI
jgi:hypothetical protein